MRIAIDAMGGDHAPGEIVRGAVEAAREFSLEAVLVGQPEKVQAALSAAGGGEGRLHGASGAGPTNGARVEIVPASEIIGFDEAPVQAVRRKKDSSLVVALGLLQAGQVQAVVSAGHTGALMAGGLFSAGRIKGIDRPALSTILPTREGFCFMLDVGANADADARNLLQFALMGSIYADSVLGVRNPRVALLSIGTEAEKGSRLTKEAFALCKDSGVHFVGNIEARDILEGVADVVVADGFSGNVALKAIEGAAAVLMGMIKEAATGSVRSKLGGLLLKPALERVAAKLDYAEYGGAPLLGLDGAVIKCHGSSKARAIRSGIRVARDYVQNGCIELIHSQVARSQ
ncbi:MAG: phosphate acyltransferase PlsX [Firmicutes bacterium]|nr:phosphate acyltransferase PlsX [Bacillota bacterium]